MVGGLFRYSHLWHWPHLEGREEGDKDRPVLVLTIVDESFDEADGVVRADVTINRFRQKQQLRAICS
ncbi:hypothetical protein AT5A_25870 [Agrobacterium tumefaciens 5A]|nr:hypothetical protein AT5A_25870 [Agrobacterium tumefaciens 5A]